jgi:inositol phosphorylceramide mannosyltransferase catalytic subunit
MHTSAIRFLRTRHPWLLRPFAQRHWRRKIDRAIHSGGFVPETEQLVHFADYERSQAERRIPLIFHQTWRVLSVPRSCRHNRQLVLRLHPSPPWEHRFWVDADIPGFVRQFFPQYWEPFQLLPKVIMRIDMFRYMLLWTYGGVYADTDFCLFKPIDDLIADCTLLLPAESDDPSFRSFLGQHFLASCPQHVFWKDCIDACLDQPANTISAYDNPLIATGPILVTRVWRSNPDKYRAKIPMRVYLAPPTEYAYIGETVPKLAYGIHECRGTWR